MSDTGSTKVQEFVLRRVPTLLAKGTPLSREDLITLTVLGGILALALVYVVLMYIKDSRSVGAWSILLGLLRTSVYLIIAFVYLLPSTQNYEQTTISSKAVLLFDASSSMIDTRDDPPVENQDPLKLPSRQDKVLAMLKKDDNAFLRKLTDNNAITAYRFGSGLDEGYYHFTRGRFYPSTVSETLEGKKDGFFQFTSGRYYSRPEWEDLAKHPEKARESTEGGAMPNEFWAAWLKPSSHLLAPEDWDAKKREAFKEPKMKDADDWKDAERARFADLGRYNTRMFVEKGTFDGTNVYQSLHDTLDRERNNLTRAIVLVSDGRSHLGSQELIAEIRRKAKEKNIPIIVVGVGAVKPQARIEVVDLRHPRQIQPDDPFRIVAEIKGDGLAEKPFSIELEITKVKTVEEEKDGVVVKTDTKQDITLVEQRPPKKRNPDEKPKEDEKEEPLATVNLGQSLVLTPSEETKFDSSPRPRAAVEFQIEPAILAQWAAKGANEDIKAVMKTKPLAVALASLAGKDKSEAERSKLQSQFEAIKKWGLGETLSGPKIHEEYRFKVRVKKHELDTTAGEDHLQKVGGIRVLKKPLSVLLFTSSASKDYQFLRELLIRETQKDLARLTLVFQTTDKNDTSHAIGVVHGVPERRLLTDFPTAYNPEKEFTKSEDPETINDLASYDVVVALDPDWRRLREATSKNVAKWVENGGGLILLGGPIYTRNLTARRFGKEANLKPIIDILPVELEDVDAVETPRKPDAPWNLKFGTGATPELEFLKLTDDSSYFRDAWEKMYGTSDDPNSSSPYRNGFYSYYPVKKALPGSQIIAYFGDEKAKAEGNAPMPYFVISDPRAAKRVVWIGSTETWRLRQAKEAYHERFWTKLLRYAGARTQGKVNKRVTLEMGGPYKTDQSIQVDATALLNDGKKKSEGEMKLTLKPRGIVNVAPSLLEQTLKPKVGSDGIFSVQFRIPAPGTFDVELDVADLGLKEPGTLVVEPSNLEKDDTRPDFDALYKMASDLEDVKNRMPSASYDELLRRLARPKLEGEGEKSKTAEKEKPRLFFDLNNAELIPSCVDKDESVQTSRGRPEDLWDTGFSFWNSSDGKPILSKVLLLVVGLLSLEWLIRKLLRLA